MFTTECIMEFGPHALYRDPLNLAFADNRVRWLKAIIATGYATPAHEAELATLKARIAAYYAKHVQSFIDRVSA